MKVEVNPSISDSVLQKQIKSSKSLTEIREHFVDSLNIGKATKNRIEIINRKILYDDLYGDSVSLFFYTKKNNNWVIKNEFHFERANISNGCNPQLQDFNKDGYKDITYESATAARGANEVRRLFIYDRIRDSLIYIKNSEEYPNMVFNKALNCIDAWLVYGGSSTVFLKISKDSLREFASIHSQATRTVYEMNKEGKEIMTKEDKIDDRKVYARYKNYKPIKEYTDKDFALIIELKSLINK